MGKNRDRLSILASILEATGSGATKTRIMFRANLSFKLLEKYLDAVISAGFVRFEGSIYALTDLGREFLKQYKNFHDRHVEAQKLLETLDYEHEKLLRLCKNPKLLDNGSVEEKVKKGKVKQSIMPCDD